MKKIALLTLPALALVLTIGKVSFGTEPAVQNAFDQACYGAHTGALTRQSAYTEIEEFGNTRSCLIMRASGGATDATSQLEFSIPGHLIANLVTTCEGLKKTATIQAVRMNVLPVQQGDPSALLQMAIHCE